MPNGRLPNDTDDRESLARKITADAHLGEVCHIILPVPSHSSPRAARCLKVLYAFIMATIAFPPHFNDFSIRFTRASTSKSSHNHAIFMGWSQLSGWQRNPSGSSVMLAWKLSPTGLLPNLIRVSSTDLSIAILCLFTEGILTDNPCSSFPI